MASYAVATKPGELVTDLGHSLDVLRAAFPPGALRFELVEQACPGAAELLIAAGLTVTARMPLMALTPENALIPDARAGVEVSVATTAAEAAAGHAVAHHAFGMSGEPEPHDDEPGPAVDGGSVVARVDGAVAAVASWTQVADGVTEIVGIATAAEHRRKGLATLVTAHAVKAAQDAGATLTWLTPGDDGAEQVYANVGFTKVADAIHFAEADA